MRKSFAVVLGAVGLVSAAHADTLLWYRFDGDGATIENKANPGTMDGTLKSINAWGSLGGLGNTSAKFPTRGDAFPEGTRIIDPVADVIQSDTVKSLSFSGDPDNSGTVFLDKRNNSDFATLEGLSSFTCEVMFKLPENSETLSSRISKEILFPLVGIGSAITTGQGWSICLRNDNDGNGFYPFVRCQYKNGANATGGTLYDYQITSSPVTQGVWHHLALSVSVVGTTATFQFYLDYTPLAAKSISDFYGINYASDGAFPLLVGANLWRNSKSCCFMGEIAEVRVSDTALEADELLRPVPPGPVDSDTLVYLPLGDCDWFGSPLRAGYTNIYYAAFNAALAVNPSAPVPSWTYLSVEQPPAGTFPSVLENSPGNVIRGGALSKTAYDDSKSVKFEHILNSSKTDYKGYVLRIPSPTDSPYSSGDFTVEWFFRKSDVKSSGYKKALTMLYSTWCKIMVNTTGYLYTRIVAGGKTNNHEYKGKYVDDDQWHHYALVYDKKNKSYSVWLDYKLIASDSTGSEFGVDTAINLGGLDAGQQVFDGQIDDFRITRRQLNSYEFLATRPFVSTDLMFAHFDDNLSTGQDQEIAPDGVGGTLGGGTAPTYVDAKRKIDLDGDGKADYESTKALRLDGGSVVFTNNYLLECRDFTVEWFTKYEPFTANDTMLLRFGGYSDIGKGSLSWALFSTGGKILRLGAYVSTNRYDKDFVSSNVNSVLADGRWHHWALTAETPTNATPANTTFKFYKDYVQVGDALKFDNGGAGGILALPTTGSTLSIGTGGGYLKGVIDELRFRPGVQPVSSFMRRIGTGLIMFVK